MPDIIDMAAVRRAHRGHWFDPASMRFFRSRVGSYAWRTDDRAYAYFVSSEQWDGGSSGIPGPRLYSVRVCDLRSGTIETVDNAYDAPGEGFQRYSSRGIADRAARRYAKRGTHV